MLEIIGDKQLYQWDSDRTANVTVDCDEVHFSNLKYGESYPISVINGVVKIPGEVLMKGETVYCWAFIKTNDGGHTRKDVAFEVKKRPKPSDYVYTPAEIMTVEKAVEKALQQAKESGEFTGEKGEKGDRGEPGQLGKDGGYYAPFVVQDSPDSFTLGFEPNGEDMPGLPEFNIELPQSADGYTPQKGVDYWTPTDKQEIVDEVLSSIPVYNGEVEE